MLQPIRQGDECAELDDPRFRNLMSQEDWMALPHAVRARFSKRRGGTVVYVGEVLANDGPE